MSSSSTIGGIFNIYQGNVGIGTEQPTESLQVIGGIVSTGPIKVPNIVIVDENGEPSADGTLSGNVSGNATSASKVNNTLTVGSYLTGDNFDGSAASTLAVDATDANTASKVVARDASGNFSAGTITASLSGTATQVSNTLTIGSYLTGDNFDGSAASTIAVDATDANTANKVVARDASGDFSAGTITASLSGNATTATTATQVGNTLTVGSYLTGDNFDGSAASTIAVDATDANTANKVVARDGSGNFSAGTITLNEINGDDGSLTDPTFTFSSDTTTGMFKLSGESGLGFTCGNSEKLRIDSDGNVGIGTNNSLTSLSITPSSLGAKITLYDSNSTSSHLGFGVSPYQLNYDVFVNSSHVFYAGGKNGTGTELM